MNFFLKLIKIYLKMKNLIKTFLLDYLIIIIIDFVFLIIHILSYKVINKSN